MCDVGVLDDAWHERVAAALADEKAELAVVRAAQQELGERREAARALVGAASLRSVDDGLELTNLAEAVTALKDWWEAPSTDVDLAQHLTSKVDPLVDGHDCATRQPPG